MPRTRRIATLADLKRDATAVYRAGRKGKIDSAEVSRWMFSVGKLGDIMERADIEPRLDALEAQIAALAKHLGARL